MVESVGVLGKRKHSEAIRDRERAEVAEECSSGEKVYEVHDGLRFVKPYPYEFKTFAKRRWIDLKLIDVFKEEFKAFSA